MPYQIVKSDIFKEALKKEFMNLAPNEDILISSARKFKEDKNKILLQLSQYRNIKPPKKGIISIPNFYTNNLEDSNFLHFWIPITVKDGSDLFGLDFKTMYKKIQKIDDTEVLFVGHKVEYLLDEYGEEINPKIVIIESSNHSRIHQNYNNQINNEFTNIIKLKGKRNRNSELEDIVDSYGFPIYRITYLAHSECEDIFIPNKKILSEYILTKYGKSIYESKKIIYENRKQDTIDKLYYELELESEGIENLYKIELLEKELESLRKDLNEVKKERDILKETFNLFLNKKI